MISLLALAVILAVGYFMYKEGLMVAVCYLFCTVFAGLMAFQLWGPMATEFENSFKDGPLEGFEDAIPLTIVFVASFFGLRFLSLAIVEKELDIPTIVSQAAGAIVGCINGFLLSGFIVCVLQTLPWEEQFLGFPASGDKKTGIEARALPADQVWLKMMKRGHNIAFDRDDIPIPQEHTLNDYTYYFARHRRFTDSRDPIVYTPPPPPKVAAPGGPGIPGAPGIPGVPTKKDPKKDDPKKDDAKKDEKKDPKKEPEEGDKKEKDKDKDENKDKDGSKDGEEKKDKD
jgi:uncharacterized membrane protein required for colicin V production